MCGRFAQFTSAKDLEDRFGEDIAITKGEFYANYNVAPSQRPFVILWDQKPGENSHLVSYRTEPMIWGMLPFWAKGKKKSALINARAETLLEKPTFHKPFMNRRCLVPADGFYEWDKKSRIPYFFHDNHAPFAFAGIWEMQTDSSGTQTPGFVILTTAASSSVSGIHHRMPVAFPCERAVHWLEEKPADRLMEMIQKDIITDFSFYPVAKQVNSPKENNKNLIAPLSPAWG